MSDPDGLDTDVVDTEDTDVADTDDTDDTDEPDLWADEARFRALLEGSATLEQTLSSIAASGGFPVPTAADTWLFLVQGEGWRLAGDHNGWSPSAMTVGDGFSWAEVPISEPTGSIYKFVDGGDRYGADPWSRSYFYDDFGAYSLVEPSTGTPRLDRWPGITNGALAARAVRVYVPPGAGPWPVLYAQDGQNLFDPEAPFGYWHLQDAAAATDGLLIVGIDSTADRMSEYTHVDDTIDGWTVTAAGDDYADLVVNEVMPLIEREYGSTGLDGLLGSSLGGLISLYIADRHPSTFDFAASMSGTLGWGRFGEHNATIGERFRDAGVRDFVVYVDSGGSDGGDGCTDLDGDSFPFDDPNDSDNYCANRWFADTMAGVGYTYGADLVHWYEPDAAHNEGAWAARVDRPLALFLALGG